MKTKVKRLSKTTISILLSLLMVISMFTVGIITTNAWTYNSGAKVYLDVSSYTTWESNTVYFALLFGSDAQRELFRMNRINNTDIYYLSLSEYSGTWNDGGSNVVFFSGDTGWTDDSSHKAYQNNVGLSDITTWATTYTTTYGTNMESNGVYYFTLNSNSSKQYGMNLTSSNTSGQTIENSNVSTWKYNQTITSASKGPADASYSASNVGGTVTMTAYSWSGASAVTANSNVNTASNASATFNNAAKSTTVTLTATPADGYEFKGFYTGLNSGTQLSDTNGVATYKVTGTKSYYARFEKSEETYDVSVEAGVGGTVSPATVNVGNVTDATITATPAAGYEFSGWTVTGGATVSDANSASTKVNATATGTVTASFTEKATKTISVDVDDHVAVTVSGSSVAGQNQTFTTDGTFTAHVDDVISYSAAGNPSSDYSVNEVKYTADDGGSYDTTASFTVTAGGIFKIVATSKEKSGYYFYVTTAASAGASVQIGSSAAVPVAKSTTNKKFYVEDTDTTFTITAQAESGYESPVISRVKNSVSETPVTVTSGSPQVESDANGATYFVSASKSMGTTPSSYYIYYKTSASESAGTMTSGGKMKYVSGSSGKVWIDLDLAQNDDVFVITKESSWSQNATHNTHVSSLTSTDDSVDINASNARKEYNSNIFSYIKPKTAAKYRIVFDPSDYSADITLASSASETITNFDTYYLGGRFRIKDNDTGSYVYTDSTEGSWQTYSIKMPFTLVSGTTYKLETNQTIAQLSASLGGKTPYFIVHDKSNIYATSDNNGLNFEDNIVGNELTLSQFSGSLNFANELLFSDTESNSDGMVTIYYDSDNNKIWYEAENETAPVASSVDLTALTDGGQNNATVNTEVILTATVTGAHANAGTLTYTFINTTTGETIYSGTNNTCTTTDDTVRTDIYKVIVSSDGVDTSTGKTLRSVSDTATFKFKSKAIYRTETHLNGDTSILNNSANWNQTALDDEADNSFTKTLAAGVTYEFALATAIPQDQTTLETAHVDDFYLDEELTKYCDIEYFTITETYGTGDDTESYVVRTYRVTPRTACSNPVIHIDTTPLSVTAANGSTVYYPGKIYAVATYTPDKSNTAVSQETVTYYFAEATDIVDTSLSGAGLAIAYWNNSLHHIQTGTWANQIAQYATVTKVETAVNVNNSNQITVDMTKLYESNKTDTDKTFNIYSVELPVWATSFAFMKTNTLSASNVIKTYSWNKDTVYDYSSILLNPNRVYLLYQNGSNYYSKGVVLDEGLWNSSVKNNPGTRTFKANAINYNTAYSNNSITGNFNTNLSTRAYSSYNKALYFGYFGKDSTAASTGLNNFNIVGNLAMRTSSENDDRYYYASVQDLVAEKLDTDDVNTNGFPLLEAYADAAKTNKVKMPLFDYDFLANDKSSYNESIIKNQYLGVDFPMYESKFNGITTYSYDSSTDLNRIISDGNFIVDSSYRIANDKLGYSPFGDADKYGTGTELDVEFFMSNTGSLKDSNGNNHDITFNFSGDDDVWVYVDGVLVLDLGGAHNPSAASINFTDMKVYYKTAAKDVDVITDISDSFAADTDYVNVIDLQALLGANGVNFNNKDGNTKHTFQMFYMERGAIDSNMSVSYNLPQASGLNIKNEITANNVNPGLKEAALYSANSDYFTYGVKAQLGDGTMYGNAAAAYSGAANNSYADSPATAQTGPEYPANTNTNRVYSSTMAINGNPNNTFTTTYPLSRSNSSHADGAQFNETSTLSALGNVTYALSDKYLVAADEADNHDVTGKTDANGEFHLLGGQSASFEDKVTPHSFVQVYQDVDLGAVDDSTTPIGYETVSDNATGNYYLTSYSIYDDHSGTWIKEQGSPAVNTSNDHIVAEDNSSNNGVFYFSDYAKESNSAAMTVTFYNDIAVGDIRISKDYKNQTASTKFYFDVEFANVFGNTDQELLTTLANYSLLTYDIYDTATGALVRRGVPYGVTGVAIQGGQTAVITGVPVETRYRVTERTRGGTQLTDINKTIVGPDGNALVNATPAHRYQEHLDKQYLTDYSTRATTDRYVVLNDDNYYYNMIPRVSESYVSGIDAYKTTSTVAFTNEKQSVKIIFHYYDRALTSGTPANMNSNPTSYTVYGSLSDELANDNTAIRKALSDMIAGAVIQYEDQCAVNVVDDYKIWTSQAAAVEGIGNEINIRTGKTYSLSDTFDTYKYYHTNHVAQLETAPQNINKWVSYFSSASGSKQYVDAESLSIAEEVLGVDEVNVWIYTTPHKYNVDIYGAKSIGELSNETTVTLNGESKTVRVASSTLSSNTASFDDVYYNQRIGEELNNQTTDDASFITQYAQPAIRSDIEPLDYITRDTLTDGTKNYRFAYWSYDPAGQVVASTNAYYYYRVTNDLKLYAVYAEEDITTSGLSIYNNRNDIFVDANGVSRNRLNVILNPYACQDDGTKFDPYIKQTALVYVNLSEKLNSYESENIIKLFNAYRDQLDEILMAHDNANSFSSANVFNFGDTEPVEVTLTTKGFVRNTGNDGATGVASVAPTTKNRVQYTLNIKTSQLRDSKLMIVGAMYYNGNYETEVNHWKISDNCLYYEGGKAKSLDFGLTNGN